MILGHGMAQTDQAIIDEYRQLLQQTGHIHSPRVLKHLCDAPTWMCRHLGNPIAQWSDEEILALYQRMSQSMWYAYTNFLAFLFYRGYRQASLSLLLGMHGDLSRYWRPLLQPYRQKLAHTSQALGYALAPVSTQCTLLLWLLCHAGKTLDELTRVDFEAFRDEYQSWYRQARRRKNGHGDARLYRLERCLIEWGAIPAARVVLRHEEHFAQLRQEEVRSSILRYLGWCDVKYRPSTINSARAALLTFFLWFQEHYPLATRLDEVTRPVALAYAAYLQQQSEQGRYGLPYRCDLYRSMRQFFAFCIEEQLDTAPLRNPFATRDLPKKPEMLPRYLSDREIQAVLAYCEEGASLQERTLVLTLLHTGIRAAEIAALKASDIVQIAGAWKLHIHEGKGLKDRVIPLTATCLSALQVWQERVWERQNDFLFTRFGLPWRDSKRVCEIIRNLGRKLGLAGLTPHRFRHSFAVALLNYGVRESALQKLMGHKTLDMTLEYARILDQSVELAFTQAIEQMQNGPHSWVPNFFVQEEYTLFAEGDTVSWIQLPLGFCRRNPKLHCESDVKCFLCERFYGTMRDLPRLQQMQERFLSVGLHLKAEVVAAQIQQIEARAAQEREPQAGPDTAFIPLASIGAPSRGHMSHDAASGAGA
jgi:integrase